MTPSGSARPVEDTAQDARSRASPRDAWLFTDPTELPSTAAVSVSDRSSQ